MTLPPSDIYASSLKILRVGDMTCWGNVRWGNVHVGDLSCWGNVLLEKCPGWGNVQVGEMSVGGMSGWGNVLEPFREYVHLTVYAKYPTCAPLEFFADPPLAIWDVPKSALESLARPLFCWQDHGHT